MRRLVVACLLTSFLLLAPGCRSDPASILALTDPAEAEAVAAALAHAGAENQRVLVRWDVAAPEQASALATFFADDSTVARTLLYEYQVVAVELAEGDPDLEALAVEGGSFETLPYLTILDAEGGVVANRDAVSLMNEDGYDADEIVGFLEDNQAEYWQAADVLAAALAEAETSERMVFLHSGAPW